MAWKRLEFDSPWVHRMKRIPTIFLQAAIVLIGILAFTLMLWEPRIEGRNMHATQFEIYFNDAFLIYAYAASACFFAGLYQAFRLLGRIGQNEAFSGGSLKAIRNIRHCAISLVGFIAPAGAYLFIIRPGDDIAGGVFIGILISFASLVVAAGAAALEEVLRSGADMKSGTRS